MQSIKTLYGFRTVKYYQPWWSKVKHKDADGGTGRHQWARNGEAPVGTHAHSPPTAGPGAQPQGTERRIQEGGAQSTYCHHSMGEGWRELSGPASSVRTQKRQLVCTVCWWGSAFNGTWKQRQLQEWMQAAALRSGPGSGRGLLFDHIPHYSLYMYYFNKHFNIKNNS